MQPAWYAHAAHSTFPENGFINGQAGNVTALVQWYPSGVSKESALRLNFSYEAPDTLSEAVRRLASVLL